MNKFMQNYQLVITPLSPIHLGTGDDFLPTNYVIDNGLLYEFDPASAKLSGDEKRKLTTICNGSDIQKIYNFFKENKKIFKECAYHKVGISNLYNNKEIARCAYHPFDHLPIIPATAFKGCVRTAVLNHLQLKSGKKYSDNKRMQEELLGSFAKDMFSQFKPSDLEVADKSICSYICKVNKHYKGNGSVKEKISNYVETIAPAQYRAFSGSLNIYSEKNIGKKLPDIKAMVEMLNNYHIAILNKENKLLKEKDIVNEDWRINTTQLLKSLQEEGKFSNGEMALIRLGKFCGAASKTIPQVAKIKVHGKFEEETTMLSLTEDKLPMGWALLEINPSAENTALKTWCENNNHIVQKIRQAIKVAEEQAEAERLAQEQAAEAERLAQEQA